ncbi:glycosyltransferase family 2 protein [Taibaiella sp. KBW10]|uniref:glycosyltransferase family 2 protein n=1 Tax=Taibaiella sp. KBW10 TaxID=2153357 RepID=UPI0018F4FBCE|nr:glycosyltransferase family 2 protein [Taibaiella sp. KBW10]
MPPRLVIVIPCYNEEEVLPETSKRLTVLLKEYVKQQMIAADSYVLLTDDGSKDKTWSLITALYTSNPYFKGLKLSRNFGHQNALLAGLFHADDADIIISIDADLQDDLNAMAAMIAAYQNGYDVVYGVRDDRSTDTSFKRNTALWFYKLLSVMGVESVYNHADYRLLSRRAMDAFKSFEEANLYLRGMVPMIGFKQTSVYYNRGERFAGESKYNFRKMLSFAWNGISSLSIKPLRFVTFCGFAVFMITILLGIYALVSYFTNHAATGWASTVIPMYFLGGIQLLCIGLIGEYVAKMYKEVKQRPRFIIEEHLQ